MDLDLTSLNAPTQPRRDRSSKGSFKKSRKQTSKVGQVEQQPAPADPESRGPASPDSSLEQNHNNDVKPESTDTVELVEIDSTNPLISYKAQVYSCTWTDMVGTNMFFSQPSEEVVSDPLRSTEEYDLIGTSRIKLAGHRARLVSKPKSRKRRGSHAADSDPIDSDSHDSPPDDAKVKEQKQKQALFLERLSSAKRARGETDNVTTVLD